MNYKKILAGCITGLLLFVQNGVFAEVPQDAPKDIKYILGFYYGNGENILIRENNGDLELLYRFAKEDKCFDKANIFPLKKDRFDSYTMYEYGPMSNMEAAVRFERDADGYGITCKIGGNRYSRYFLGQGIGENAKAFRFPEISDWDKLRSEANNAVMPETLAAGQKLQLTNIASIAGIKVDSQYAGSDNCFGAPLYTVNKLYLGTEAVAALEKVHKDMAVYGYGLLIWDAYRPWSVSKLAHLALPEGRKYMLEDPDIKGSTHNTGRAVDVSLYDLQTGEAVDMISAFDEPSMRQYASYAGGSEKQRYLRDLLRAVMEKYGFGGIEMEWWHFEFNKDIQYAHLNIPLEQLQ